MTSSALQFRYPYEEFADHIKAMRTVRKWEYTSRFGHLGDVQTSRANSARVVEYFSDSYSDPREAICKAEVFLSIYDYVARQGTILARKGLMEEQADGFYSVDPALLRAVHFLFTTNVEPAAAQLKNVLALAKAFQRFGL